MATVRLTTCMTSFEVDLAKAQEALPQERPAREDEPEDATIVKPKAKMSL